MIRLSQSVDINAGIQAGSTEGGEESYQADAAAIGTTPPHLVSLATPMTSF